MINARTEGVHGIEQVLMLCGALCIGIDEKPVCLTVSVFLHCLETVEAVGLGSLDLLLELLNQILLDDPL